MQGIWVDYKSFHGELRGFRSSCRRNEAAFGGEAVAKSDNGVRQLKPVLRIYDDYVAERSLVPSAAATKTSQFAMEAFVINPNALHYMGPLSQPFADSSHA